MYDKEEEIKQIAVILYEINKLEGTGILGNNLLQEFEHIREVLKTTIYDWNKVANHMIGLWQSYAGNPENSEDEIKIVHELIDKSIYALRELSENRCFFENNYALIEQLILRVKENSLNLE